MINKTNLMIELLKEFSQTDTNKILCIIEKLETKKEPKMLTSDRIMYSLPFDEVLNSIRTEKGMRLLVDNRRFGNLQGGQQIDIYIDVVE